MQFFISKKNFGSPLSSKQNPVLKFYAIYDLIDRFFFYQFLLQGLLATDIKEHRKT